MALTSFNVGLMASGQNRCVLPSVALGGSDVPDGTVAMLNHMAKLTEARGQSFLHRLRRYNWLPPAFGRLSLTKPCM